MKDHVVDLQELRQALRVLSKARPAGTRGRKVKRGEIPILRYFKLEASRGQIVVTATDIDTEVAATIKSKGAGRWSSTVPGNELATIAAAATDAIRFGWEINDDRLHVETGAVRFALDKLLPVSEFPTWGDVEYKHRFDLATETVAEGISRTAFAISTEETRYYLNGIYIHPITIDRRHFLRMVTTDGHRMSVFDMKRPGGLAKMRGVIVPRKAVGIVAAAMKGADSINLAFGDVHMEASVGPFVIRSKLIDGTYPDYQRVFPGGYPNKVTGGSTTMLAATRSLGRFAADAAAIKVTVGPTGARFEAKGLSGEAQADVGLTLEEGEPFEVGFNGRYLTDALRQAGGGDVVMQCGDGMAALVSMPDHPNHRMLLMPMRV